MGGCPLAIAISTAVTNPANSGALRMSTSKAAALSAPDAGCVESRARSTAVESALRVVAVEVTSDPSNIRPAAFFATTMDCPDTVDGGTRIGPGPDVVSRTPSMDAMAAEVDCGTCDESRTSVVDPLVGGGDGGACVGSAPPPPQPDSAARRDNRMAAHGPLRSGGRVIEVLSAWTYSQIQFWLLSNAGVDAEPGLRESHPLLVVLCVWQFVEDADF